MSTNVVLTPRDPKLMANARKYSDTLDIRITDSSLRDGSHHKRHQFTEDEVRAIVGALDEAGVPVIEVTHGDGLGGSSFNYGFSAVDEMSLIKAAVAEAHRAKIAVRGESAGGGLAAALAVASALIRQTYPTKQLGRGLGINSVIVSSSAAAARACAWRCRSWGRSSSSSARCCPPAATWCRRTWPTN